LPRARPDPRPLPNDAAGVVSALATGAGLPAAGASGSPDGFVSVILFVFLCEALT
jgi:hypothetical protein